jgi:uncharacterized membrane protein YhiD involved in acid resistance
MFLAAGVTVGITLITLIILGKLEKLFFPFTRNKVLELSYKDSNPAAKEAVDILKSFGVRAQSVDVAQSTGKGKSARLRILASVPDTTDISKLAKALKAAGEVSKIEIKEKY